MSGWTALVPFKLDALSKSRLAGLLPAEMRQQLALKWLGHVTAVLGATSGVETILLLSPAPPAGWTGPWAQDQGRGLNPELTAWRADNPDCNLLVIHGDLPHVTAAEIESLLALARSEGAAMATDHTATGTNALALTAGTILNFTFGVNSRALHCGQCAGLPALSLPGLAADIDTPEDFARWQGTAPVADYGV